MTKKRHFEETNGGCNLVPTCEVVSNYYNIVEDRYVNGGRVTSCNLRGGAGDERSVDGPGEPNRKKSKHSKDGTDEDYPEEINHPENLD
jgi:hypothetical protein